MIPFWQVARDIQATLTKLQCNQRDVALPARASSVESSRPRSNQRAETKRKISKKPKETPVRPGQNSSGSCASSHMSVSDDGGRVEDSEQDLIATGAGQWAVPVGRWETAHGGGIAKGFTQEPHP